MADHPDFYTDGVAVSVGPFGVTVTFLVSQPSVEAGPHIDANEVVARVRLGHALAKALAQNLNEALAQQPNIQQTDTNVRH
jgi:hypothetical protein